MAKDPQEYECFMRNDSLIPEDMTLSQAIDEEKDSCIIFKGDGEEVLLYLPKGCEGEDGNCNEGGVIATAVMCILDDPRVRAIIKEQVGEMMSVIDSGVLDE